MRWLWRVFNQGWPDGHEDSTKTWGHWSLISAEDAERLSREDAREKRYEFVPYLPSTPPLQAAAEVEDTGATDEVTRTTMPGYEQYRDYDTAVARIRALETVLRLEDALQLKAPDVWRPAFAAAGWNFASTREPAVAFLTRLRRAALAGAPAASATRAVGLANEEPFAP